ncbi:MAG: hypothetical protein ABI357_01675 [Granulicella sp.]
MIAKVVTEGGTPCAASGATLKRTRRAEKRLDADERKLEELKEGLGRSVENGAINRLLEYLKG